MSSVQLLCGVASSYAVSAKPRMLLLTDQNIDMKPTASPATLFKLALLLVFVAVSSTACSEPICMVVPIQSINPLIDGQVSSAKAFKGIVSEDCMYMADGNDGKSMLMISRITVALPPGSQQQILTSVPSRDDFVPVGMLGDGAVLNTVVNEVVLSAGGSWFHITSRGAACPYSKEKTPDLSYDEIDRKCSDFRNGVATALGRLVLAPK